MSLPIGRILAFGAALAVAASAQTPGGVWRRFDDASAQQPAATQPASAQPAPLSPAPSDPPAVPPVLTLPAGTWITIRLDQPLSSDHNQPGDAFTGTLMHPLVVNGLVVAHRGQTIGGRVAEAQKAGRVKGTAKLGLEVTEIRFADGQQLPVRTEWVRRAGDTSVGRDVGAVGATAGGGAAVGALAAGPFGAGVGALAGAAAATIGVLVTRGHPAVVTPESVLTFRLAQPVTLDTSNSHDAFQPVRQADYASAQPAPRPRPRPSLYGPPPPAVVGYYAPGPFLFGGPVWWGPGFYRRW